MAHPRPRRFALAAAALLLLAAGPSRRARAQDGEAGRTAEDYRAENGAWNGLADLFALARGLGMRPEMRETLDWDLIDRDTAVVILYPRAPLDEDPLVAHLLGGGRVLLGDDFGAAGPLLARLGIARRAEDPAAARRFRDNPHLPIARPLTPHELTRDVAEVVTNHPIFFRSHLTPILGFGADEVVCAVGRLGPGTLVVLSDPSVLINNMLDLEGNLAFAVNLLRFLARPGERLVVVTGAFSSRGFPAHGVAAPATAGAGAPAPVVPPRDPASTFLRAFDRFLGGMADFTPSTPTLRALLVLCGGAAVMLLMALVPRRRRDHGAWTRTATPPPSPFEESLRRHGDARSPRGCGMLASILRDEVEERLCRDLDLDAVSALDPARAVPRARARAGEAAARILPRLLRDLARVPPTERAYGAFHQVSRRQLAALHAQVERLFQSLDGVSRKEAR